MSERAFRMPDVEKSEWVLYKPGPNSVGWDPMFVTDVFSDNINGIVIDQMSFRTGPSNTKMKVIHADDPRLADPVYVRQMAEEDDQGVFVLAPSRLRIEARLSRLEEDFKAIVRAKGKTKELQAAE